MAVFVRTPVELATWLARLERSAEVALDTEFHPERHYFPELMLVQLRGDEGEAVLVDARAGLDLRPLGALLAAKPLLVHGGAQDVAILARLTGHRPARWFDTQLAAGFCGLGYPRRLVDVAAAVTAQALEKGETMSDWSRRPLSPAQLRYAADDVLVLAPIARELRARVEARGHGALLEACLEESLAEALAEPDDASAWRRLGGAHLLDDGDRAVLAALAAWREGVARTTNAWPAAVVPDGILLDLARRRPRSLEAMRENRRMPGQVWRQHGEAILRVLAGAATLPVPGALPAGPRADALRLGARLAEQVSGIAASLSLPERELAYILRGATPATWQAAARGESFSDFISNKVLIGADGCWHNAFAPHDR